MLDFFFYIGNVVWITFESTKHTLCHFNFLSQSFDLKISQKCSDGMMVKCEQLITCNPLSLSESLIFAFWYLFFALLIVTSHFWHCQYWVWVSGDYTEQDTVRKGHSLLSFSSLLGWCQIFFFSCTVDCLPVKCLCNW